jgi:uncharacterized protein
VDVALFAALVLTTTFVGAVAGYGSNVLALPFVAWMIGDARKAVAIVLLLGALQAYLMVARLYKFADRDSLKKMLLWCAIGVPFGLAVGASLPQRPLMFALGLVVTASGALALAKPATEARPEADARAVSLLMLGGIFQGAFASGGGPIVLAARRMMPLKDDFRATMFMFWMILNTCLIAVFALGGRMDSEVLTWFGVGLVPVMLGNIGGNHASKRISQAQFRVLVAALLVVMGLVMMGRNLNWG